MSRWRITIPEGEIELDATDEADATSKIALSDLMDGAFAKELDDLQSEAPHEALR